MLTATTPDDRSVAPDGACPAGACGPSPARRAVAVDNNNAGALHSGLMTDRADRVLINFRIDRDLMTGLKFVANRDGVPQSEQVRRAIRAWLESRKAIKAERKRPASRQRS